MAERTRDLLWSGADEIYREICAHPFLTGLVDGSLGHNQFRYYISQDAHYLRGYARALALCAAKAPDEADVLMFTEHAGQAIAAERQLHTELLAGLGLAGLGLDDEGLNTEGLDTEGLDTEGLDTEGLDTGVPVGPVTQAYLSYLLATAHGGCYAEAVAAVLPCYWIYARVGEHLQQSGSPDPLYQRWIDMYAGEEYQAVVDAVLTVTDRIGAAASESELGLMRRHFHAAARYEWMFFDAAYRMADWPV